MPPRFFEDTYDPDLDYDGSGYGSMGYKLMAAASNGSVIQVQGLLERGVPPDYVDPCGNTPLHCAARLPQPA